MATLNKASVREEVDRLKQEFDQLCSDDKVHYKVLKRRTAVPAMDIAAPKTPAS